MEFTKYLQTCCNRFFLRVESCPLGAQGCAIICLSSLRQARFSIRVFLMYVSHGSCSLRVHLYLGDSAPPCPNDPQMFSLDCYQSKRRGGGMCEWKPQFSDEEEDSVGSIDSLAWISAPRHCSCGHTRSRHTAAVAPRACHPRLRAQVRHALFRVPRSLAQAQQLRPDLQRQRLPDDERPRRSHLSASS